VKIAGGQANGWTTNTPKIVPKGDRRPMDTPLKTRHSLQIGAGRLAFPNTFSFLIQDRLPPPKGVWIFLLFTFKARTKVVRIAKALKLHALNKLPFWWMALVVSVVTYLVAGVIFAIITALASGQRVR
jgi:hypothetical protein